MNKGLLIALAVGGAALLLSKPKTKTPTCTARLVRLPSGEVVCETVLPAMGFILWTDPQTGIEKWYHRTQFQPPSTGQYSGILSNSAQWQNILNGLISQGINLAQQFQITNSYQGEPWAGDSGGGSGAGGSGGFYDPPGGSGDPYSGMAGTTPSPHRGTKYKCNNGRYSQSQMSRGACTKNGGIKYRWG